MNIDEMTYEEKLFQIRNLFDQGKPDEGLAFANEMLNRNFDDPQVLFLIGYIFMKAERFGLAYNCFKRSTELNPNRSEPWNNMGMCYQEQTHIDQAEACLKKSLEIQPDNAPALNNLSLLYVNKADPEKSIEYAEKALEKNPGMLDAINNRGLAYLMQGRWKEGWEGFDVSLGREKQRRERVYKQPEEPRWNGEKDLNVVCYGEQGIGDEISGASCLPDLIRDSKQVYIDCDPRLKGLLQRSFPTAVVYGTRFEKSIDWPHQYQIDSRVAIFSLPKFYRNSSDAFPGTPYLIPDPERRIQWRALFDFMGPKLKVGLSWIGGRWNTNRERRSLELEQLLPILSNDCDFVSLQYKDARKEIEQFEKKHGIKIHQWARGTLTNDYDDTAAMVAELDLVISVTTAAVHLCGAIGKECWTLVPQKPRWFYGVRGETIPWYKSVKLYRQTMGNWPINYVADLLAKRIRNSKQKFTKKTQDTAIADVNTQSTSPNLRIVSS